MGDVEESLELESSYPLTNAALYNDESGNYFTGPQPGWNDQQGLGNKATPDSPKYKTLLLTGCSSQH